MHSIYRYILCTIFTSLVFCQTLDIETLERLVVDGNPHLAAGLQLIEAQSGKLEQSRKYSNPEFEFESGIGFDPEISAMLSQSIPLGGKRKQEIVLRNLQLKQARLEYDILKQEKLEEAYAIFMGILHLQKLQIFQNDRVLVSKDLLNAVSRKVEAGKLSPAEKSRARIQLYQEKLTLRDIETSLKSGWRLLASFWGEEHSSFTEVEGNLTEIPSIPTLKFLDTAPTIRLSKLVVEIQQANIKLEKANGVPDIELGGGVKQSDLPENTYQFGLSIPLPIFNRNQGNIGSAKSELKKARFELKEVEIQVQTILFRLKTELEVLASEIDILKNDIIPEAQAAYTTISEGYLNGRFTYLDVVDTQRMWFESREQYIGALKDYHTNILELDRIMGNTYGKETH